MLVVFLESSYEVRLDGLTTLLHNMLGFFLILDNYDEVNYLRGILFPHPTYETRLNVTY